MVSSGSALVYAAALVIAAATGCSSCGKDSSAGPEHVPGTGADSGAGAGGAPVDGSVEAGVAGTGGQAAAGAAGGLPESGPPDADIDGAAACGPCTAYGPPEDVATLQVEAITELSGLAASRQHPGVVYAHNDSGDSARFFAVDLKGAPLGEFQLTGAAATDWEDMDLGPCPGGTCVFLADIGDNASQRAKISIYRVAEPEVSVGHPAGLVKNVAYERFEYQYEGGPRNAETLMAHPGTGDLYIVSKVSSGDSTVFRIPAPTTPSPDPELIHPVATVKPPAGSVLFTGGALHPCGTRVLLRTYSSLWEYEIAGGSLPSAFASPPAQLPVAIEVQGEAVTYSSDGRRIMTASEGGSPVLHVSACIN